MLSLSETARRFWLLWLGTVASTLGGAIAKIALPVFVAGETGSPLAVSAVVFGFTAPRLLLGLPLGLLVDRRDRRRVLVGANAIRLGSLALLALALTTDLSAVAAAIVVAVCIGSAEIVDEPAVTALVPAIVEADQLDSANRRFVAAEMVVEITSQPLGGALVGIGLLAAVVAGGFSYLIAVVGLLLVAGFYRAGGSASRSLYADVTAGLVVVWNQPVLRGITLMAGVINACWTAWIVAFVLHALDPGPMGLSEWNYGLVLGADGIGGAVGVFSVGFVLNRLGRRWAIGINILGNALMFFAPLLTLNIWLTAIAVAIGGIGAPIWGTVTRTLQQRITPADMLGRVSSAYRTIAWGANALGTVAGGVVAELFGLDAVFLGAGVLTLAMLVPFQRSVTSDAIERAQVR